MSTMNSVSNATMTSQDRLLLTKILGYFRSADNFQRVLPVINGTSDLSIRIIDWFVTNYAKGWGTTYTIERPGGGKARFNVFVDYKLQLKSFYKRRFDPFCRANRINVPLAAFFAKEEGLRAHCAELLGADVDPAAAYIETTIGQLNFFKWAMEKGVVDYISAHFDEIERDMNERNLCVKRGRTRKEKDKGLVYGGNRAAGAGPAAGSKTRKRREELTVSAMKSIKRENVEVVVSFS